MKRHPRTATVGNTTLCSAFQGSTMMYWFYIKRICGGWGNFDIRTIDPTFETTSFAPGMNTQQFEQALQAELERVAGIVDKIGYAP